MGLALCSDATGNGPACPGLECYTGQRARYEWLNKNDNKEEGMIDNDVTE